MSWEPSPRTCPTSTYPIGTGATGHRLFNEIASGKLTVKDLSTGTQSEVAVADVEAKIRQLFD